MPGEDDLQIDNHEKRAIEFARRFHERMATRILPFRWGSAFIEDDVPLRYGSQFLWVDGGPADANAEGLMAEADRVLGGEGFDHRIIGLDDVELADTLASAFESAGWSQDRLTLMVLRDDFEPKERKMAPLAQEVSATKIRPLLERVVRAGRLNRSEDAIATLSNYSSNLAAGVGARFLASADTTGELVAGCDLYVDGDDAQIESINTLSHAQKAGHGTAVVLGAIEAALSAGANWIHLYADADDWPRHWYEKLGFESVGSYCEFRKFPE